MNNNDRSREHGVIDQYSIRTVGMTPELARQVIREEEDLRYPLLASSLVPPTVSVQIEDTAIGTLINGLGANWSPPAQGEEAFPDEDDQQGWQRLFAAMTYAGISWVRYWLPPQELVQDGKVDAEHRFFRRLDRLQQWACASGATIMLEFAAIPQEYMFDDVHDAPRNSRRYVSECLMPLLHHILIERNCDCIRQVCLFNEPFNADVTPYLFMPGDGSDPLEYYLVLHEILRVAMDDAGWQHIGLIGPNTANMFQRHIEMFEDKGLASRVRKTFAELDVHMWRLRFDYYPPSKRWPGYPMTEGIERYLKPTLAAARRMGKSLSITEAGSMYFNENPCTTRVTQHDAYLVMAEGLVRAINEGVAGAMIWSFTSAGHTDGRWGWIGTREERFAPVPNLLNGFAALMRYHRPGAAIHHCVISKSDFSSFISAGALRLSDDQQTIWLVNDHPVENITVRLQLPATWNRKTFTLIRKNFRPEMQVIGTFESAEIHEMVLPGMSMNTLTTLPV